MNPIINRKQDILYKDLAVDLTAHRVSRAGHELLLTPREFALLAVLVTHCDTALSRSQLLEAAWGYAFIGESACGPRTASWTKTHSPSTSTACAASSACKTTSRPSTR